MYFGGAYEQMKLIYAESDLWSIIVFSFRLSETLQDLRLTASPPPPPPPTTGNAKD